MSGTPPYPADLVQIPKIPISCILVQTPDSVGALLINVFSGGVFGKRDFRDFWTFLAILPQKTLKKPQTGHKNHPKHHF